MTRDEWIQAFARELGVELNHLIVAAVLLAPPELDAPCALPVEPLPAVPFEGPSLTQSPATHCRPAKQAPPLQQA